MPVIMKMDKKRSVKWNNRPGVNGEHLGRATRDEGRLQQSRQEQPRLDDGISQDKAIVAAKSISS